MHLTSPLLATACWLSLLGLLVSGCGGDSNAAPAPMGASPYFVVGTSSGDAAFYNGPDGSGNDLWAPGTGLVVLQRGISGNVTLPASRIAGKPYTATVRIQTADPNSAKPGVPGNPISGGVLALDLVWSFESGADAGEVTQSLVASIQIDPNQPNDKTVTFTGTVPQPPTTPSGFEPTALFELSLVSNAATTAEGQSANSLELYVSP